MSTDTQQDAREQARHQIAVMQAWLDGKEIQWQSKAMKGWKDCPDPEWRFDASDYRVKPE